MQTKTEHLKKPPAANHTGKAALGFLNATKTYGDGPPALDNVSFDLKPGQFTVLLGPSGSGKSTLLRAAVGLVGLSAGEIRVQGRSIAASGRQARQCIGMVHQDGSLSDRLTAAQNVLSAMAPSMGWLRTLFQAYPAPLQRKACRLLARVGLTEDQANRRVRELSGGQRQRVGIARALMNDPDLILADEPVASLDPATARSVMTLLRETAREYGATVLCSLHQIDLACDFADRIIGLRAGKLVFDGEGADLTPRALAGLFDQTSTSRPFDVVSP
ncbi:phosphonate ABC transporter ATP-binding protein [Henriciella aquimarina]|uniref:phosphonate ABC transporter ATP-binding protein n=1 Tax=Henriciella aquimarina TaxID=545261 RepID=UPI0009FD777F|nr:phosphonate ABC transporter ATP-binding protein [Henriciella aquimarina]